MHITESIAEFLKKKLLNAEVIVTDPYSDGTHLEAVVISEDFDQMTLLEQHKSVMSLLKEPFRTSLHALKLKTFTPEDWKKHNKGSLWTTLKK